MGMAYDPKTSSVTPEYMVETTGDPWFIPGNGAAYGDEPNAGTKAERVALCTALSPKGTEAVV